MDGWLFDIRPLIYFCIELHMRLRTLRSQNGLSVRTLARRAEMSYTFVSNVENGKADPSLSTLRRLAKALDITVSELIGEKPP